MRTIDQCQIYGILDLGYVARMEAVAITGRMLDGGIDVIQIRAKGMSPEEVEALARSIHPLTREAGTPLVINDHPEIAERMGAEGLHLGQDDSPLNAVRGAVPAPCFLGKSTHSREQAVAAVEEGADYIGFGPLFATPTKPDYQPIGTDDIRWVHENVSLPIFCIGGIVRDNLESVIDAGARRVVIVSGILKAADIESYIRDVKGLLPPAS